MSPSQTAPVCVLVVDDDPTLLEQLCASARSEKWECIAADSVADALTASAERRPAVAVVAHGLPDGNGNDLICELRHRHPGVLCILMTGRPDLENAVGAVSARAFAYLVKPFPPAQLNALVHSALETRRLREDYQEEIIRAAEMHAILEAARLMQDRINNPLQGIMANAELIQMVAPDLPPRVREIVAKITRGCDAVGDIVHRLAQALTDQAIRSEAGQPPDLDALLRVFRSAGDEAGGGLPGPGRVPEGPLPQDDRRTAPRYACSSLMLSVPVGGTTRWLFVDNVSAGGVGLRLLTLESLPPRFEARLWDLESREAIPVDVEVCWAREDDPSPAGLRFVSDEAQVREFLDGVLTRIRDRSGTPETKEVADGSS